MTLSAKRYRVSCRCSATVAVGPGQAGGRVDCPACGGTIVVPRLRELEPLVSADAGTPPVRWRPCQAWLLLGATVAATAAIAAAVAGRWSIVEPPRLPESAAIRGAIGAADAATIHKAWQAMRSAGVDRGPLPEELRMQKAADMADRVGRMLWTVAAAGAAVAAAAGIACLATSSPADSRAPPPSPGGSP